MRTLRMRTPTAVKSIVVGAVAAAALASASGALADQRIDHQQPNASWGQDYGSAAHHWQRGQRIGQNDWNSAQPVDYRAHHLRAPPRGYAWRQSNGQYVLAAVATGVIASIILSR